MEVLPLVADCCLPPLLPAAVTVVATTTVTPVSITIIHHICHCIRLQFTSPSSQTSSCPSRVGDRGRRRRQKGAAVR